MPPSKRMNVFANSGIRGQHGDGDIGTGARQREGGTRRRVAGARHDRFLYERDLTGPPRPAAGVVARLQPQPPQTMVGHGESGLGVRGDHRIARLEASAGAPPAQGVGRRSGNVIPGHPHLQRAGLDADPQSGGLGRDPIVGAPVAAGGGGSGQRKHDTQQGQDTHQEPAAKSWSVETNHKGTPSVAWPPTWAAPRPSLLDKGGESRVTGETRGAPLYEERPSGINRAAPPMIAFADP